MNKPYWKEKEQKKKLVIKLRAQGYSFAQIMKEVGFKFGKFLDVTMMQLIY